jgi:hypothetical protein
MIITAMNKMCHSERLELSWSGVMVQTTQMSKDTSHVLGNLSATERLLRDLGPMDSSAARETYVWHDAGAAQVASYVDSLSFPPESARAGGHQLASFIRIQAEKTPPELTSWTVALVSIADVSPDDRRVMGGLQVGLVTRTPESQTQSTFGLRKANILNPTDEAIDFLGVRFDQAWLDDVADKEELDADQEWLGEQVGRDAWDVALDLTVRWQRTEPPKVRPPSTGSTQRPSGRVVRVLRRRSNGLLLIYPLVPPSSIPADNGRGVEPTGLNRSGPPIVGLALSFPTSNTTLGAEYQVNKVWGSLLTEDGEYED